MTTDKKIELAQQLSKEYGMEGRKKQEESHFDRTTGTLFIGSHVFHYEDMEKAKNFMHDNMVRMRDKNDAACDMYAIGELAVEKLMEQSMASGGRLIIKEGD